MNAAAPTREQLSLPAVLEALANPLRLRVVAQLAAAPEAGLSCGELLPDVSKSTASHHWRILRDAGILEHRRDGRHIRPVLRRADLDARFPGLLDVVLANARELVRPASATS
ncbi:helix-turn-helix transcriptional regulator [Micromonospora sp. HM5-17]|jgi:DNA-binding transcriptional ArsR family regulator|uniref:ArsR/SmtB family transcription factor n=1 Tax=Micromonospora sp. HM5-17 TaxID=2487710 RepID=UPI000F4937D5|nr:helix-turn-helix domain-containing protein [Micromonospora sp. HM5-17]ROT32928.1 ArsR family transcriptional regulator [Micromonospora sp. HM5-17]